MKKPLDFPVLPPLKLNPNPNQFRILYQINTVDEVMSSAYTRYAQFGETTILASSGHTVCDDVFVYHAKPGADKRNARFFSHLKCAKEYEERLGRKIEFEQNVELLPQTLEDRMRLFIAFRILLEASPRDVRGTNFAEQKKKESVNTIIDLCPGAVIIHGRIPIRSGSGTRLERFGVAKVLKIT